jgi:hypothetical protein
MATCGDKNNHKFEWLLRKDLSKEGGRDRVPMNLGLLIGVTVSRVS